MALAERWLLPDGVKEILPPEAEGIESARRRLIDLFISWGYDLVMPPLMEHLDALLTGAGKDLDLNTFKIVDQLSGRTLGIRADTTPQVARIDAHRMHVEGANRLCYCGSVLHARSTHPLASRNPLQLGAELYGHSGVDSDVEVIALMLEAIRSAGVVQPLSLDLGHVGFFNGLMAAAELSATQQADYQDMLQRKALPELDEFVSALELTEDLKKQLLMFPRLHGGIEVLEQAKALFGENAPKALSDALLYVQQVAERVKARFADVDLYFDLSELRGYNYHTGIVFAAYSPVYGQALAKGGRYDNAGADFGRARPATGFSADLKDLLQLADKSVVLAEKILAPAGEDVALLAKIKALRAQGKRVMQVLSGEKPTGYSAELVQDNGQWIVRDL
ncbi:MAG: ATP phosphoribosyltransferase regulatory subunit [Pontibacterium sp.]